MGRKRATVTISDASPTPLQAPQHATTINYNLRIKGYQVFQRNFRKNITCGGVALAIHHTIPAEPLIIPDQLHHIQLVGATIFSKAGPVTFISKDPRRELPALVPASALHSSAYVTTCLCSRPSASRDATRASPRLVGDSPPGASAIPTANTSDIVTQ
ncbi:hypothetical protein CBL_05150 [Carabus blaptoides fortunei]